MRRRASSLQDKPVGTGATGCESGSTRAGVLVEDTLYESRADPASGGVDSNSCRSAREPEPWGVASRRIGSKGVIVAGRPTPTKEPKIDDWTDLHLRSLRRRRTKGMAAITTSTATTLPVTAPAIIPICDGVDGDDDVVVVALASIGRTGALKVGRLSGMEQSRDCFIRTLGLMVRTMLLVRDF